jgi:hypothetical protein
MKREDSTREEREETRDERREKRREKREYIGKGREERGRRAHLAETSDREWGWGTGRDD